MADLAKTRQEYGVSQSKSDKKVALAHLKHGHELHKAIKETDKKAEKHYVEHEEEYKQQA